MRLVVDVDGTGHRELTNAERAVLQNALENYRKCKSAEKLLKGQAYKSKEKAARDETYATYDKLLNVVKHVREMTQ